MLKIWMVGALALAAINVPSAPPAVALAATESFTQTWDGSPASPLPWDPDNWDVTVHSRDLSTWHTLEPIQASHGADCGAPPATHLVDQYADTVFECKNHLMTAIKASGYGLIYLTPDRQVDFSTKATISVDVSTLRTSLRDWWDIWITPFGENLQAPLEQSYPDLSGPPKDAIHIVMGAYNNGTVFKAEVFKNFQATAIDGNWWTTYESKFTPDAARRDTFQLDLTRSHIKFGMPADPVDGIPAAPLTWIDANIPQLDWSRGVVQFGHHSYNPAKDAGCGTICQPNTWHWDNVKISPAVPFTIVRATSRALFGPGDGTMTLRSPAPANGMLRFMAVGANMQVSFDQGQTWTAAKMQQEMRTSDGNADSYWTPIPEGTTTVMFRGSKWFGGDWTARDVSVWADNGVASPNSKPDPAPDPNAPDPSIVPGTSDEFTSVAPTRLLDTRPGGATADGQSLGTGVAAAGSVTKLAVGGRGGVPASAAAVVLTVTAAGAAAAGYVTVYPCDAARPTASNLNFAGGSTVANTVVTKLGADGTVCLFTGDGNTQLLADVTGYLPAGSAYIAAGPSRLLDTRSGASTIDGQYLGTGAAAPGSTTTLQVGGRAGVPKDATAVILTVTAANATRAGYLTVYPCGTARPTASNVNFAGGGTVANTVVTQLGADGAACIFSGDGTTQLLTDVTGYLPAGSEYSAVSPARLLDTRSGASTVDGKYLGTGAAEPGETTQVQVNGRAGVPTDAAAVMLTITAVGASAPGYLTVYPCGTPKPTASNVNYGAGTTIANSVLSQVGIGGLVCIYSGDGSTQLLTDVTGYFPATSGLAPASFGAVTTSLVQSAALDYCELPVPATNPTALTA